MFEDARPLIRETRSKLPESERLAPVARARRAGDPSTRDLRAARTGEQLQAAGAAARAPLAGDPEATFRAARQVSEELLHTDVSGLATGVQVVTDGPAEPPAPASAIQRRARRDARTAVDRACRPRGRRDIRQVAPDVRGAVRFRPELLAVQKEALARVDQTLAIVRETEKHAESLARTTGGPFPFPLALIADGRAAQHAVRAGHQAPQHMNRATGHFDVLSPTAGFVRRYHAACSRGPPPAGIAHRRHSRQVPP